MVSLFLFLGLALVGTTGELDGLFLLLRNFTPLECKFDFWIWSLSDNQVSEVRTLAQLIDEKITSLADPPTSWSRLLPNKVNLFIWRLRRNFMPCFLQLSLKGVYVSSISCRRYNGSIKNIDHTIFRCDFALKVWSTVSTWCGLSTIFL